MENLNNLFGCTVCGQELFYTSDKSLRAKCYYCGRENITHTFCPNGRYVCDKCHRNEILERVELECSNSDLPDPVELTLRIFDLSGLHMHGPEYHSIVPAILVTAYGNSIKNKNKEAVNFPIIICASKNRCPYYSDYA